MIANIEDEMLLGVDILQNDDVGPTDLILSEGKMMFGRETIPLNQVDLPSALCTVYACDEYVVLGLSEMILDVFVDVDESDKNGLFTQNFIDAHPLMLAPTLVDTSTHATVKARVINPFTDSVIINQNTVVGVADHVEPYAKVLMNKESDDVTTDCVRRIQIEVPNNTFKEGKNISNSKFPDFLQGTYDEAVSNK